MIPWLAAGQPFPDVERALRAPNGLLAASTELTVERLIEAYKRGIFPWYSEGEPVLWWSPDPRMVLRCAEFRVSRSLQKVLRRSAADPDIEVCVDRAFGEVMRACAAPRSDDVGTWITPEVLDAYGKLHARGLAHSVETWIDGELAGGLYGVSLGRMFYGESMFARAPNASKIALAALVQLLHREGVAMIDCQQNTRHLASLGGREIARHEFLVHVRHAVGQPPIPWNDYRRCLNAELTAEYGQAG
ncbi:MAG TPA: leucyl/phenylalanyl-tRNA--protein transferase [Burkholderiaceae bacterium]|nr:leucyl/phenylalanyl-tRNA--protein transferase [Burkholderiaceae bacterium]HQR69207.1 leucyl/phenylalanyl-tRNA--protein transferase [Burkholderiaceae bacterium]